MLTNLVLNLNKKDEDATISTSRNRSNDFSRPGKTATKAGAMSLFRDVLTIESTRAWWDDNPDATLIDIEEEVRRQIREREQQGRKGKK